MVRCDEELLFILCFITLMSIFFIFLFVVINNSYELGEKSRGTGLWVKMKPEYGDQTEDLDLLILGMYIPNHVFEMKVNLLFYLMAY